MNAKVTAVDDLVVQGFTQFEKVEYKGVLYARQRETLNALNYTAYQRLYANHSTILDPWGDLPHRDLETNGISELVELVLTGDIWERPMAVLTLKSRPEFTAEQAKNLSQQYAAKFKNDPGFFFEERQNPISAWRLLNELVGELEN